MKFRIQQDPTFSVDVDIPRAGGATVSVPFTFKYLDRDQLAQLEEERQKHREEIAKALDGGARLRDLTGTVIGHQVKTLTRIVAGWGFEDDFTPKNLKAFVSSMAAAPEAVLSAYNKSYEGARLGN